ncbi:uncharacterized protein si:zfos-1056e6.1 isoform X2 [Notolabrus celidotus]|uniref:uncharacterized protein si:zfos-1056e6.1 isoform X2 n=1 Tax=Notolabrus celidotus TaxID=1203425 RepID=UPI00149084DE|nr:uncharacterized protein si:zfos-1056e6.1 isoform X2 [Notolabrus celidotus]
MEMSNYNFTKNTLVSKVWIALRRLDLNDDRVIALREASIPPSAEVSLIVEIITTTFGLISSDVILKMRNHCGCLIPMNSSIPANSKHMPYVLEVAKVFQHVRPKPRTIPMTVLNRSMTTRLQTIDRRIEKLGDLLPQIKLRRNEKLNQEIECLDQKLRFLHKRLQFHVIL